MAALRGAMDEGMQVGKARGRGFPEGQLSNSLLLLSLSPLSFLLLLLFSLNTAKMPPQRATSGRPGASSIQGGQGGEDSDDAGGVVWMAMRSRVE